MCVRGAVRCVHVCVQIVRGADHGLGQLMTRRQRLGHTKITDAHGRACVQENIPAEPPKETSDARSRLDSDMKNSKETKQQILHWLDVAM